MTAPLECWRCFRPVHVEGDWLPFLCSECFQPPAGLPWWRRLAAALADRKGTVITMLRPRTRGRVRPHLFIEDKALPADHRGWRTCATCHLVGTPTDAHHQLAPPPPTRLLRPDLAAAARARDAAVLGEHDD